MASDFNLVCFYGRLRARLIDVSVTMIRQITLRPYGLPAGRLLIVHSWVLQGDSVRNEYGWRILLSFDFDSLVDRLVDLLHELVEVCQPLPWYAFSG